MVTCPNCHFSLHSRCVPNHDNVFMMCPFCRELLNNSPPEEVVVDVSAHDSSDSSSLTGQQPQPQPQSKAKQLLESPSKQRRFNQITDYIHGNDCSDLQRQFLKDARMDRRQPTSPTPTTNFEFFSVVFLKSRSVLADLRRRYEVKEVKQRAAQRKGVIKFGVFMAEPADPGVFIDVFLGHTHLWSTLVEKANGRVMQPTVQPFVLVVDQPTGMAIDARRSGNEMRFMRRSCRPNVSIKPVVTTDDQHLWFAVFAMNGLRPGEELLAPIDGLPLFKYECACQSPELCLAPADLVPEPTRTRGTDDDYSYPYERHNSISVPSTFNNTTTTVSSAAAAAAASAMDQRKMSREERKLQRYIEFFEKMDAMDAKGRKRSASTVNTASVAPQPPAKKPSPVKPPVPTTISNPSSPNKSPKHLLKKQWLHHKIVAPTPILTAATATSESSNDPIIDVVSLPTPPPPNLNHHQQQQQPQTKLEDSRVTPLSQIISQEGTSVAGDGETPTRKRLSLNDYLEKRRKAASPLAISTGEYDASAGVGVGGNTGNVGVAVESATVCETATTINNITPQPAADEEEEGQIVE